VSPLLSPLESPDGFSPNEFMVNIGLALKDLAPEKWGMNLSLVNFNALPEVYLPKPLRLGQFLVPIGITVGIGALLFMGFLVWNSMAHNKVLRSELTPIESRITLERGEIATLQAQIGQIEVQLQPISITTGILNTTLTSLGDVREEVDGDLSEIVSLLPAYVDLTEVEHEGDTVTVKGIAPDEKKIFKYARDLRSSDRDFTVLIEEIKTATTEEEETEGFEFTFGLK
jgi:Tfp pilus assembly protein PilN